jgi:hypothetical protein
MDVDRDVHACLRLCNRPGDDWAGATELGHLHTSRRYAAATLSMSWTASRERDGEDGGRIVNRPTALCRYYLTSHYLHWLSPRGRGARCNVKHL